MVQAALHPVHGFHPAAPCPLPRARRVADGTISMEEARQRHQQLLKRQFFGREPPPYDPSRF